MIDQFSVLSFQFVNREDDAAVGGERWGAGIGNGEDDVGHAVVRAGHVGWNPGRTTGGFGRDR